MFTYKFTGFFEVCQPIDYLLNQITVKLHAQHSFNQSVFMVIAKSPLAHSVFSAGYPHHWPPQPDECILTSIDCASCVHLEVTVQVFWGFYDWLFYSPCTLLFIQTQTYSKGTFINIRASSLKGIKVSDISPGTDQSCSYFQKDH